MSQVFRLLILVASCSVEASWLPTVLNMLMDVSSLVPLGKRAFRHVLFDCVLNGQPLLHLTLWIFKDHSYRQGSPSSVSGTVAWVIWVSTTKVCQQCREEWAGWYVWEDVSKNFCPKIGFFFASFIKGCTGLAYHWHSQFHNYSFLEPYHLPKASGHPVITTFMCHLYLQHLVTHKTFSSLTCRMFYYHCKSWAPASSCTNFKLAWKTVTLLALVFPNVVQI